MSEEAILKRLEDSTRYAVEEQIRTLQTILDHNGGARYLASHFQGYNGPLNADSFRRFVPISSYDDYVGPIQALADGDDRPILSVDPLICFFYSSGTNSSKPKMIPYFDSKPGKEASYLAHQASAALVRRLFPPRPSKNKVLWFLYAGKVTETEGGIKAMAASAFPFHNNSQSKSQLLSMCISPVEVLLGSDTHQQTYCHLLCGLRYSNSIDCIRAPYAAGLIRAFHLLESKWRQLCEDIDTGTVSSEITDVTMRDAIVEFLGGPQPDIADRIRSFCEGGEWGGVLIKLWPELRYISCVTTGSMEQYYAKLKYYAGDSVMLLGGDYFTSECGVAINMERSNLPQNTKFVMLPTAAYFEFLPFDVSASVCSDAAVDFSGVEVGKMYEVVTTTYRGLYRYRLGDIVKVIGFYNSSPEVEYVMRAPKAPGEVLTEKSLISAMERLRCMLREETKVEIVEFASFVDLESSPKHVVIFIEPSIEFEESMVFLQRFCLLLEDCLGSIYKVQRKNRDVGPLEISVVKPGSFYELFRAAVENGAPANQYKPPKILRNRTIIDLLKRFVIMTVYQDSLDIL
ncbi:probable indole-3-acetic acid-amido synthetase GH3.6 [Magnolia sinica]|uniref:probable indole-3-acetic acid-amido synthetase GH3.6 n=1 Tax=Magnolia sinica TaxID=86752 RepID=UPI0026581B33|nr:probable indole-3-acetic acid-amido synthetase GH3.6 [Magnolia sinica]